MLARDCCILCRRSPSRSLKSPLVGRLKREWRVWPWMLNAATPPAAPHQPLSTRLRRIHRIRAHARPHNAVHSPSIKTSKPGLLLNASHHWTDIISILTKSMFHQYFALFSYSYFSSLYRQACRQGGVRGGSLEPLFWPQKILCTAQLHISLLLESGPLALLPLRITTVQTSLVAAMHPVCS